MPFQFNRFHILVEGLRWCLRNPFPSILYHISVLKGISSAQALLLLPLVAPMVAGQLSSFEQLRQAWLGSVVLDNRTSHSSPWSGRRPPRPPLELRAVQGKTGGWDWQHLTPGCDTDTMQESWWFAQVSCWHISLQLEQWTGQFLFICSCGGLHVFGNHTETITSSISTQLNKVVTFLKSTSRTFVPSNR